MDEKYRDVIEETLDEFDFNDAEEVFKTFGFTYSKDSKEYWPDYIDIKRHVRELCISTVDSLIKSKDSFSYSSSGHFFVLCWFVEDRLQIRISFEIESVESYD